MHLDPAPAAPEAALASISPIRGTPSGAAHLAVEPAIRLLQRRYGDAWIQLPSDAGRPAARTEALLTTGPAPVASEAPAAQAVASAAHTLAGALVTIELVSEAADLLGEVLSGDLIGLTLGELADVAEAVLALRVAPVAASCWAWPAHARASEVVLRTVADDLRACAALQTRMHHTYTDGIWEVTDALLERGSRWRPVSRRRLRRELAAASRTGRVPGRVAPAAAAVAEARRARQRIVGMAGLLSVHLGEVDRGPLTDVDAALAALGAVRQLQAALGARLLPERLGRLLTADAFRSAEASGPARDIGMATAAWSATAPAADGHDPLAWSVGALEDWCEHLEHDLPHLRAGLDAVAATDATVALHDLVDHLLAREHVQDQTLKAQRRPSDELAPRRSRSAS